MEDPLQYIAAALGTMRATGPRALRAYLEQPAPDFERASPALIDAMIARLLSDNPNEQARLEFSELLRSWDNTKGAEWTGGIPRNTKERRQRIHELLKSGTDLAERIDKLLPFYPLEEPLIIAQKHLDWYVPRKGRDYYWATYVRYLRQERGWGEDSVLSLDNTTRAIVECLADPEATAAYASRGLVMGYVQSGKTANFAGVVARAADAGYRLIIILAGTWNILRNQTQRRLDKELLGKELLRNDEFYRNHPPADWAEFLEHGGEPSDIGQFTWQRLTRPEIDFRRLNAAIDSLELERANKALPIYHPENLHRLPVKLLVVKKHSGILEGLVDDLGLLQMRLTDLPALIIDDESDQAGINTVDPRKAPKPGKERTATNRAIVKLLKMLPRGQYVGYTATPYANALIPADDNEDLFPKDFIISLDRPSGYMGVSDFFDPTTDFADLSHDDCAEPEIAFIRRVERPNGQDDEDLKGALRSYVLAGALKLYRLNGDPQRYEAEHFKHHTMLIHTSSSKELHSSLADRVKGLWDACAFNSPSGRTDLEELWDKDYRTVSAAQGKDELRAQNFLELVPHLAAALQRIVKDQRFICVVNSDRDEAPDFSAGPVWKIVIGGNKLSRGYTVEGLTVSYYRRRSNTADTLMQMGRWFGFRPGYRDLVRVYLGVKEGRTGDTDLVALFKEVCRMEERFRDEIKRYLRRPDAPRITPRDIPPLIAVSGNLPPTARNKMHHARVTNKNYGGCWSMPTLMAAEGSGMKANLDSLRALLSAASSNGQFTLGGRLGDGKPASASCLLYEASTAVVVEFLSGYRWLETDFAESSRPADVALQIEFLENARHGIHSWLIIAPQRKQSFGEELRLGALKSLKVKERHRVLGRGFGVLGEPEHRKIAECLATIKDPVKPNLTAPNPATADLVDAHRGVFLLYPVRETQTGDVSVGFELLYPKNDLQYDLHFTVSKKQLVS
jgi:hypothetical protein